MIDRHGLLFLLFLLFLFSDHTTTFSSTLDLGERKIAALPRRVICQQSTAISSFGLRLLRE